MNSFLHSIRRFDRQRPSFPGEHWMTAALGTYMLSRKPRGLLGSLFVTAVGSALLYRAASGRDGLLRRFTGR